MTQNQKFSAGDFVVLEEQPDGYNSKYAPVTVGKTYQVLYTSGSNLVTTSDVPGETAHLWRGRFRLAEDTDISLKRTNHEH